MGGHGSTRWRWHPKREVVENCFTLDITRLVKTIIPPYALEYRSDLAGTILWTNSSSGQQTASIGYKLRWTQTLPRLIFHYTAKPAFASTDKATSLEYSVELDQTFPHYGGVRWWFICPLVVNGQPCQRRVSKLYLPPNAQYFGCRHCYDLTYSSAQTAHVLDRRTDRLGQSLALFDKLVRLEERVHRCKRWSKQRKKILFDYTATMNQYRQLISTEGRFSPKGDSIK